MRSIQIALIPLLLVLLAGCVGRSRCCPTVRRCGPRTVAAEVKKPPARASVLYRGSDGKETTLVDETSDWGDVDLVAFGELHGDLAGAAAQLELLQILAAQEGRPLGLAMEFFERNTQADLDAYLAGTLDREAFLKQTKRPKAYLKTHGPLIDFCKEQGIPVIAANAPRKLVTGYRKSEEDYEAYRAGVSDEERAWLPEESEEIDDEYRARFVKMMGEKRGASYFRSQSLWDDAMAEAMVDFRAEHPNHRILFIVGGFHVQEGFGTITKYRNRRGKDEVRIISMGRSKEAHLPFDEEDLGKADLILLTPVPKRKPKRKMPKAKGPNPHKKAAPKPGGVS